MVVLFMGLVSYLKAHLKNLLVELCGTEERASFWLAFSNVTLVLVPLIFALDYQPEFGPARNFVGLSIEAGHRRLCPCAWCPRDHSVSINASG